ncbi:MAG: ABC transporter ATP-binding protein [Proteobacteria bacterium]|nr:ABC transporter ATP-binding protein [Pseudomonadota bacterium]MBU4470743.1 ABC transporter ATP-binding protein [Pseudomonadota bacterium]MCG2751529.1 ABC transporter ATP-binding protein [Desulfobacteraceae bacterium]
MGKESPDIILTIENLVMAFGGLMALYKPDIRVKRGSITAIIGPNGAGKTTLFNIITGFLKPDEGSIQFNGNSIKGLKPHEISKMGISRTFQTVELFDNMTVLENVMLGFHTKEIKSFILSGLRTSRLRNHENEIRKKSEELLKFIGLHQKWGEMANNLPLGEQKILEIGRALASSPTLLCLDEPAAGLNETESYRASSLINAIREKGTTILLVEHDMKVIMNISDQIVVLNYGQKIACGTPEEIQRNVQVIEAYLGDEGNYVKD